MTSAKKKLAAWKRHSIHPESVRESILNAGEEEIPGTQHMSFLFIEVR